MKDFPVASSTEILGASHLLNAVCLSNPECADLPAVSKLATDLISKDASEYLLTRLKAVENAVPAFAKLTNGLKVRDIVVSIALDKAVSIENRLAALTTLKALPTNGGETETTILDMITDSELDAQLRIKAFEVAAMSPTEPLAIIVEKHIKENDVDQGNISTGFAMPHIGHTYLRIIFSWYFHVDLLQEQHPG